MKKLLIFALSLGVLVFVVLKYYGNVESVNELSIEDDAAALMKTEITLAAKNEKWNGKKVLLIQYDDILQVVLDDTMELDKSAWMGICPQGVYILERLADRARLVKNGIYENNTFLLDLGDLAEDQYTIVFCNRDRGGDVIFNLQLIIDSNGKTIIEKSEI